MILPELLMRKLAKTSLSLDDSLHGIGIKINK
jgi:hypothetical protein